ncbi:MAG: hypothetical protein RLZZ299_1054 [Pseudomonadota bacterium]
MLFARATVPVLVFGFVPLVLGCGGDDAEGADGSRTEDATLTGDWTADPDYQIASSWDTKTFREDGTYSGYLSYPLPEEGGFYEHDGDVLWLGDAERDRATNAAEVPIYLTTERFSWEVFRPADGSVDGIVGAWSLARSLVVDGSARSDEERVTFQSDGTCRYQRGNIDATGTYEATGDNGYAIDVSQNSFGLLNTYFLLEDGFLAQANYVFVRP